MSDSRNGPPRLKTPLRWRIGAKKQAWLGAEKPHMFSTAEPLQYKVAEERRETDPGQTVEDDCYK